MASSSRRTSSRSRVGVQRRADLCVRQGRPCGRKPRRPRYIPGGGLEEGPSYSVQPATSPTAGSWDTKAGGTEFFLSALDFDGTTDNRIAIWSLTNTQSLGPTRRQPCSRTVSCRARSTRPRPRPTRSTGLPASGRSRRARGAPELERRPHEPGRLCRGTALERRQHRGAHVERLELSDEPCRHRVLHRQTGSEAPATGAVQDSGYVSVKQDNVLFPSIGVNASGKGVM